jgi:hypothetical protein
LDNDPSAATLIEERITSARLDELQKTQAPPVLYHYTSQTGLLGILATGELWATKVQYMNDATEFAYGLNLFKDALQNRFNSAQDDVDKQNIIALERELNGIANINICAVSFCINHDLLSLWRGYASSGGCAIGFSSGALKEMRRLSG